MPTLSPTVSATLAASAPVQRPDGNPARLQSQSEPAMLPKPRSTAPCYRHASPHRASRSPNRGYYPITDVVILSAFCAKSLRSSPAPTVAPLATALNLRRHQIHQRENKHPHQIHKMPIQTRHFHIMRVIIFRLQKNNDARNNQPNQQLMHAVMKNIVRRNQKVSRQPQHSQNRQKPFPQRYHAEIDHANRHMQHVHRSEPEKCCRKLGPPRRNLREVALSLPRRLRKSRQRQTLVD